MGYLPDLIKVPNKVHILLRMRTLLVQYVQLMVFRSLDTYQLYNVFVFLAVSKDFTHSNSYLEILSSISVQCII